MYTDFRYTCIFLSQIEVIVFIVLHVIRALGMLTFSVFSGPALSFSATRTGRCCVWEFSNVHSYYSDKFLKPGEQLAIIWYKYL